MLIIGKNHVGRQQLAAVAVPQATDRFTPVPHLELADLVASSLTTAGFSILSEDHVLGRDGLRYFGGFELARDNFNGASRRMVAGVRNSHDKSFAAAICIGNRMLVCENLCFSAEKALARRHSKFIARDLPGVVSQVVGSLTTEWEAMETRIEKYKGFALDSSRAAELAVNLVDASALPKQSLYDVIHYWRKPELAAKEIIEVGGYDPKGIEEKEGALVAEFGRGENLWGLYNSFTHCLKGSDVLKLPARTMRAQSVFDAICV